MSASEPQQTSYVPAKRRDSDYPLIDNDPHFNRVIRYFRPSDYAIGISTAAIPPIGLLLMEKFAPSGVGKGGFAPILRLSGVIGIAGGFLMAYQRSSLRFHGVTENSIEIEKDMREMVDRVKKGEPIYGKSSLTEYQQGVAARNSRYSNFYLHMVPWFNFVNHNQHGVDTAKYYQQAERELETERLAREG